MSDGSEEWVRTTYIFVRDVVCKSFRVGFKS